MNSRGADRGQAWRCAAYIPDYLDSDLEVMVATHPDANHIGGLDDGLAAFVVEEIWLNGDIASRQTYIDFMNAVNAEGAQVYEAQRRDQITLSDLTFYVLHPTLPLGSDRNENLIVLKLSFGQVDFLFTGDVESEVEANMVAAGLIDDIDILKGTIVVGTDGKYLRCWTHQSSATGSALVGRSSQDHPGGFGGGLTLKQLK